MCDYADFIRFLDVEFDMDDKICDICGYEDQTTLGTAVHRQDDGLYWCQVCLQKHQFGFYARTNAQKREQARRLQSGDYNEIREVEDES